MISFVPPVCECVCVCVRATGTGEEGEGEKVAWNFVVVKRMVCIRKT